MTICTLKLHLNGDAEARQLKSGDYVVIELRDEGEGMPEHVAARAALHHAGLWDAIQPKLVLGENAAQAMQFAAAGSSQGGIVPLSLSKAPEIAKLGTFALIPADWHATEPLRQRMALTKQAGATARQFYDYLRKPAAREIFIRYGFVLPGDALR